MNERTESTIDVDTGDGRGGHRVLPIIIGALLVIAIVCAGVFTVSAFGGSPAKKFTKLQETGFSKIVKTASEAYEKSYNASEKKDSSAQSYSVNVKLSPEIAEMTGFSAFKEAKIAGNYAYDADNGRLAVNLSGDLNGDTILTAETVWDKDSETLYALVPQLSEKYLSVSADDFVELVKESNPDFEDEWEQFQAITTDTFDAAKEILPPKEYERMLNEMVDLWLACEPVEVTLEKGEEVELSDIETTVDLYTAKYDELALMEFLVNSLDWLTEQEELIEWLEDTVEKSGESADIMGELEDSADELREIYEDKLDEYDEDDDPEIVMTIQLGLQKKEIAFAEIEFASGDESLFVECIKNTNKDELQEYFAIRSTSDESIFCISHEATLGSEQNGKLTLGAGSYGSVSEIEIEYEDYISNKKDTSFKATVTIPSLAGTEFEVLVDATEASQEVEIAAKIESIDVGSVTLAHTAEKFKDIKLPKESYNALDEDELSNWVESADVEGFMKGLSEIDGIEELIDGVSNLTSVKGYDYVDYDVLEGGDDWYSSEVEDSNDDSQYSYEEEENESTNFNGDLNYDVTYNGKTLTIPCTVDTLANEWDLVYEDREVAANSWDYTSLYVQLGDDFPFANVSVDNDSSSAKQLGECLVTSITQDYTAPYYLNAGSITFPANLCVGDIVTKDELVAQFGEPIYEYEDMESPDWQYGSYNWNVTGNSQYSNYISITIGNNEVITIDLDRSDY